MAAPGPNRNSIPRTLFAEAVGVIVGLVLLTVVLPVRDLPPGGWLVLAIALSTSAMVAVTVYIWLTR